MGGSRKDVDVAAAIRHWQKPQMWWIAFEAARLWARHRQETYQRAIRGEPQPESQSLAVVGFINNQVAIAGYQQELDAIGEYVRLHAPELLAWVPAVNFMVSHTATPSDYITYAGNMRKLEANLALAEQAQGEAAGAAESNGEGTSKVRLKRKRGRPADSWTEKRAEFAKHFRDRKKPLTYDVIYEKYCLKYPKDSKASPDAIRLAYDRSKPSE